MADWWARRDNDGDDPFTDALTACLGKDVVEDTVSAFRTALQQANGVESAADLQDEAPADDEASSESLDYFAPAFRQAVGDAEPRASETEPSREPASARSEAEAPSASLDYFTAALPSVAAPQGQSDPTESAFLALGTALAENAEETTSPEDSLDYFAPALRRALGHAHHSGSTSRGAQTDGAGEQGPVEHLKAAAKGLSEREVEEPSEPERSGASHSGLDLERLAKCLFTPSRGMCLNGG